MTSSSISVQHTNLPITELTFSNSMSTATLPSPEIKKYKLVIPNDSVVITGQLIGYATSHRMQHIHHKNGSHAIHGEKCSACRWFEVRIFKVSTTSPAPDGNEKPYIIHTQGPTIVPDEYVKCRLERAVTGHEVVELLTVRREENVFLPAASARALAQAAGFDKEIENAYVNRAVI